MKINKKYLILTLVLLLTIININTVIASNDITIVNASENEGENKSFDDANLETLSFDELVKYEDTIITNEYEMALKQIDDLKLNGHKYSLKEKAEILNKPLEIKKHILELSEISEDNLSKMNYSSSKINHIKSLKNTTIDQITDYQAMRASANLAFNLRKNTYNSTNAVVDCYWAWQTAPYWPKNDILAFAWTSGHTINTSRTTMKVTYKNVNGNFVRESRFNASGVVGGCKFTFPQSYSSGIRSISEGKAYVVTNNTARLNYIEIHSSYGHNSGTVIPSFTISRNPISITFGSSTTEMGHDYVMMQ